MPRHTSFADRITARYRPAPRRVAPLPLTARCRSVSLRWIDARRYVDARRTRRMLTVLRPTTVAGPAGSSTAARPSRAAARPVLRGPVRSPRPLALGRRDAPAPVARGLATRAPLGGRTRSLDSSGPAQPRPAITV
uniref:hypothetical protein n=1 Tax=Cumulibacter manganitolerans TaxID=1884992 RepID=UPI001E611379